MKLIVFDTVEAPGDVERMCEWVRTLGLDPEEIRPWGALVDAGDGWKLHLLKFRRDTHGNRRVVSRGPIDDAASDPIVVDVPGEAGWPEWFPDLGPVEVPDAPGETVVWVLWLANVARREAKRRRLAAMGAADGGDGK